MISRVHHSELPRFERNSGRPLADQIREKGLFCAFLRKGALRQGFAAIVVEGSQETSYWLAQGKGQSVFPMKGPLYVGHDDDHTVVGWMRKGLLRSEADAAMRS